MATKSERDLYDVLGAPRDATPEALEREFRSRADALAAEPDAVERLAELSQAFAVLSQPSSRLLYDRFGFVRGTAPLAGSASTDPAWVDETRGVAPASAWSEREPQAPRGALAARSLRELRATHAGAVDVKPTHAAGPAATPVPEPNAERPPELVHEPHAEPTPRFVLDAPPAAPDVVAPAPDAVATPTAVATPSSDAVVADARPRQVPRPARRPVPDRSGERERRFVRYAAAVGAVAGTALFLVLALVPGAVA